MDVWLLVWNQCIKHSLDGLGPMWIFDSAICGDQSYWEWSFYCKWVGNFTIIPAANFSRTHEIYMFNLQCHVPIGKWEPKLFKHRGFLTDCFSVKVLEPEELNIRLGGNFSQMIEVYNCKVANLSNNNPYWSALVTKSDFRNNIQSCVL